MPVTGRPAKPAKHSLPLAYRRSTSAPRSQFRNRGVFANRKGDHLMIENGTTP